MSLLLIAWNIVIARDFLRQNIEEYLIADLRSMLTVAPKAWNDGGGLGYPLVMTTFAGIEVMGELVRPTQRKKGGGREASFALYWEKYLYPGMPQAAAMSKALYEAARHGIAHAFLLKGPLKVAFQRPEYHLTKDIEGSVYIDAHKLANDFIASYHDRFLPVLNRTDGVPSLATVQGRVDDLEAEFTRKAIPDAFPATPGLPLERAAGMSAPAPSVSGPSFGSGTPAESTRASSSFAPIFTSNPGQTPRGAR